MMKRFTSGLAKGALLGLLGGVVAAGLFYGLVATGVVASTGALAGIYGFVTSGGAFSPWGLMVFSTIFGAATQAVAEAAQGGAAVMAKAKPVIVDGQQVAVNAAAAGAAVSAEKVLPQPQAGQARGEHVARLEAARADLAQRTEHTR